MYELPVCRSIINEVTRPLSFPKPPAKVCAELKSKDSQICDLKYDKPIDWDNLDLDKMRVKQLKELLLKLKDNCKVPIYFGHLSKAEIHPN